MLPILLSVNVFSPAPDSISAVESLTRLIASSIWLSQSFKASPPPLAVKVFSDRDRLESSLRETWRESFKISSGSGSGEELREIMEVKQELG